MKTHDRLRIVYAEARQNWRAFACLMHVHENHYIKRAGVAGIRARASLVKCFTLRSVFPGDIIGEIFRGDWSMGFGLKDGIHRIAIFHDRGEGKLLLPNDHCHPGYIAVLAAYINHNKLSEDACNLPGAGYMNAIGLHKAVWGEDRYDQKRVNVGTNYSLVTALKNVEAVDSATSSINSCIRQLTFPERKVYPQGINDLTRVVGELHDNVWSHGRDTGFSFAQKWAVPRTGGKEHYLEFALADCGMGFFRELRRAGIKGIDNHRDAIAWCIQEGNSSKHADLIDDWAQQLPYDNMGGSVFGASVPVAVKEKENNHQGLGLYHLMKLVKTYNGELQLATGNVCLEAVGDQLSYTELHKEWSGVAISCRFKIHELAIDKDYDNEENDPQLMEIMRALGGE
ncbi:hypothetical protein ACV8SQ_09615 [Citrobacter freundii]|uniref:hypothetical protein n=1 Tax=Citrobacter freundii TaxID=546 RepID=UPI001CEF7D06|nr:hypothetical protein [Citrobacter freundii]